MRSSRPTAARSVESRPTAAWSASATALFVERGYAATTLADVAEHADIAPRTLYLHFPSKADLLLRCIGFAIAGDAEPIALADRPAMTEAMTAPTLAERVRLMASLTASLMERTGPLLDVAFQAAPSEPSIAAAAAAGRVWHKADIAGVLAQDPRRRSSPAIDRPRVAHRDRHARGPRRDVPPDRQDHRLGQRHLPRVARHDVAPTRREQRHPLTAVATSRQRSGRGAVRLVEHAGSAVMRRSISRPRLGRARRRWRRGSGRPRPR